MNNQPLFWRDRAFDPMGGFRVPAVGRVPKSEPCDERDDGFNKTSSVPPSRGIDVFFNVFYGSYVCVPYVSGIHQSVKYIHHVPGYLGITYKVGDTTTFSAGPYDESLGVPVTVHFRKD